MKDWIKHIIAGCAVAFFLGVPCYVNEYALFSAIWPAFWGGVIAGGIKEYCDNLYEGAWSWRDFLFTVLGALVAVLFIVLLHVGKG